MKKFILIFVAMFTFAISMFAQEQTNYTGSSKFTDNVSVTVQGGVLTSFDNFYSGHTAMAPIALIGVDKYVNPWFGVGVEARTLIGTGNGTYNTKTVFDWVNLSGYAKFNVLNMFNYTGERRTFEPVVYTGIGWGHSTVSNSVIYTGIGSWSNKNLHANQATYRAGVELNLNLGKEKAWGIVLNPSVVWGGMSENKLNKHNGSFEVTAGVVYHFKTSNGTRTFAKPRLYSQSEIDALNARINELNSKQAVVKEVIKNTSVTNVVESTYIVTFAKSKSYLTDEAKKNLDKITGTVVIEASASPEGTTEFNQKLSEDRANVVKSYLESRGVKVTKAIGLGVVGNESNRIAIVTVQ